MNQAQETRKKVEDDKLSRDIETLQKESISLVMSNLDPKKIPEIKQKIQDKAMELVQKQKLAAMTDMSPIGKLGGMMSGAVGPGGIPSGNKS